MPEQALEVKQVPFLGASLMAAKDNNGIIWVGIRWMCNGIGLNENQSRRERKRIQEDIVLKQGGSNLTLPTDGGIQNTLCLQLDYVPIWLAKINITPAMLNDTPELAQRLIQYQLKAKNVLAAAFLPQYENNAQTNLNTLLKISQEIRTAPDDRLNDVLQLFKLNGYIVPEYTPKTSNNRPKHINYSTSHKESVKAFANAIMPKLQRNFLPYRLLYAIYRKWYIDESLPDAPIGRNKFVKTLRYLVNSGHIADWTCTPPNKCQRPGQLMNGPEPIAEAYGLNLKDFDGRETYEGMIRK